MDKEKKTTVHRKVKRVVLSILCTLAALVILVLGTVLLLWGNELRALNSLELLRDRNNAEKMGAVYSIDIRGGFYLDDFVEQGGVSTDDELIAFIMDKITKGLVPIDIDISDVACSSFTAQTQDGDRIFGRNYDLRTTNTCVVRTHGGKGRHATISTIDLQFLGIPVHRNIEGLMEQIYCLAAPYVPLDGINDAGVSCGIYVTAQGTPRAVPTDQQTDKPDITSTTLLRLILDYADDVDEAVEIAQRYDLHDSSNTSYHYMVADASGRSAVLEWISLTDPTDSDAGARELVVTYNDNDPHFGVGEVNGDYQCLTNFIIVPEYYELPGYKSKNGLDRYSRMYLELNRRNGVFADEQEAMNLLNKLSSLTTGTYTVHSALYNLTDLTVMWIPNECYEDETAVFHFDFD